MSEIETHKCDFCDDEIPLGYAVCRKCVVEVLGYREEDEGV